MVTENEQPEVTVEQVVEAKEAGLGWKQIGDELGIHPEAARAKWRRYQDSLHRKQMVKGPGGELPEVTIIGATADDSEKQTPKDVWKAAFNAQTRVRSYLRRRLSQRIILPTPCMFAFTSDLHFGDPGTDYVAAHADAALLRDLYKETGRAFCGFVGDGINNWVIGKLKELQRKEVVDFSGEWLLFFDYLEMLSGSLMFVVAGNHENWTTSMAGHDRVREALAGTPVLYHPQQILFTLQVGKQEHLVKVRHKWPYGSIFNTTHSIEVGWERGGHPFDIGIGGHTHPGTFFRPFAKHGKMRWAVQVGTYKTADDFGEVIGKPQQVNNGCGAIVFDENGEVFTTTDSIEKAAKILDGLL